MLVLTRQVGESIIIDNQIEIKILGDVKGVRVGIEAPKRMKIIKAETIKRKKQNFKKV
jgi:carbon storage regulator CsrA